ncbi:MAG: STAS domain-containing protein [Clostridiales bacterium]|nr:STAS domain-containing protein [Clostridiales bacterium]
MVDCRKGSDALYFNFSGEIDESCAHKVRSYMDDMLERFPTKKVVMNMKDLKFMDSTGIGLLLGRYKKIISKNSVAYILNPSSGIDRLLNLSGIYQLMPKVEK